MASARSTFLHSARPVTFEADGGRRTTTPAETARADPHLMGPLTGIVGALNLDTDSRVRAWSNLLRRH